LLKTVNQKRIDSCLLALSLAAIFTIAILPIHGEEKAGKADSNQNRAKPRAPTPPTDFRIVINEQTTYDVRDRIEKHSEGYLARLFSPENIPNDGLCVIGVVGTIIALSTIRAIKKQTKDAAKEVVRLNRAYLTVDEWMTGGEEGNTEHVLWPRFRIRNPSMTAARVEKIEVTLGGQEPIILNPGMMLTPKESHWFNGPHITRRVDAGIVFNTISGRIEYRDIFNRLRHRKFSKRWAYSATTISFEDDETPNANDEEEWQEDEDGQVHPFPLIARFRRRFFGFLRRV
jgi:hypothetical protein